MPIVDSSRPITGGVATHLDNHVAAALDANGGLLDVQSFANNDQLSLTGSYVVVRIEART